MVVVNLIPTMKNIPLTTDSVNATTDLRRAKRNLDAAGSLFNQALRGLRAFDAQIIERPAGLELYYFHTNVANRATFERRLAAARAATTLDAAALTILDNAAHLVLAAYAVAERLSAEDKARLAEKRTRLAAKRAATAELGVDLPKIGGDRATVETYQTLRAAFAPYQAELEARWVAQALASNAKAEHPRDEEYVTRDAKLAAENDVASFAAKLTGKIDGAEDIGSAKVAGISFLGNLWTGSTLHVRLDDGRQQVWATQVILNTSCLGKVFNQWPTRRIS